MLAPTTTTELAWPRQQAANPRPAAYAAVYLQQQHCFLAPCFLAFQGGGRCQQAVLLESLQAKGCVISSLASALPVVLLLAHACMFQRPTAQWWVITSPP